MKHLLDATAYASEPPPANRRSRLFVVIATCQAALLLLPTVSVAVEEATVQVLEDQVQRGIVAARAIGSLAAKSDSGPSLVVENVPVSVSLPSGETYRGYLITAYEPTTELFWWTFQGSGKNDPEDRIANPPRRLTFFASEREIIGVELLEVVTPALLFLRSTQRVVSLEEAFETAKAQVAGSAPAIQDGTARWWRRVALTGVLPRDFYFDPNHAMPHFDVTLTSMERRGDGWTVRLEGREGRTAEVYLDELFNVEGAKETTEGTSSTSDPEPDR